MTELLLAVSLGRGIVGLPLVLGLVWLGGWWLFALVAVAAWSPCTSS